MRHQDIHHNEQIRSQSDFSNHAMKRVFKDIQPLDKSNWRYWSIRTAQRLRELDLWQIFEEPLVGPLPAENPTKSSQRSNGKTFASNETTDSNWTIEMPLAADTHPSVKSPNPVDAVLKTVDDSPESVRKLFGRQKVEQALGVILESVGDEQLDLIQHLRCPRQAWKRLKEEYLPKQPTTQFNIGLQINSAVCKDGEKVSDYVSRREVLVDQYKKAGGEYPEDMLVLQVFRGIPKRFDYIRNHLTMTGEKVTFDIRLC